MKYNLANNTTISAKINEVKNEISIITTLATTAVINAKINEVKKNTYLLLLVLLLLKIKYLTRVNISLRQNLIVIVRKFWLKISASKFSKQK